MVNPSAAAAIERFKAETARDLAEGRKVQSAGNAHSAEARRLIAEYNTRRDAAQAAFDQEWAQLYEAEYRQRIERANAAAVHAEHVRVESIRIEDAQRRAAEQAAQIRQRVAAARADADRLGLTLEEYLAASS